MRPQPFGLLTKPPRRRVEHAFDPVRMCSGDPAVIDPPTGLTDAV
ncbi:MAG: hypothetical protein ACRDUA_11805 [Micromonosporaceae bacterium]